MPQLGETVVEGTITKWLKQQGETVERDEPLFEISTDKVDTEVPSPLAGTLVQIKVPEGETVSVGTELAVIDEAGGNGRAPSGEAAAQPRQQAEEGGDQERQRQPAAEEPDAAAAAAADRRTSTATGSDAAGGRRPRRGHPAYADAAGHRAEHGPVDPDHRPRVEPGRGRHGAPRPGARTGEGWVPRTRGH